MKILVIGASGMIGSTVLRVLSKCENWDVWGTIRDSSIKHFFTPSIASRLIADVHVEYQDALVKVFSKVRPDVVINCVGLTKHKSQEDDILTSISINTLLPHRLVGLCKLVGARLVHVSTDCVFLGDKGAYTETDLTDANDVYGKSKALGELFYPNTITLRTSTIGHELNTKYGLLEWFLSQDRTCKGFTQAIFSGLPTVVFAQIIRDVVIPNRDLSGLYHVSSKPINKFELLNLIASEYGKSIEIVADNSLIIDRSLDSGFFFTATGYSPPEWIDLIHSMYHDR